MRQVCVWVQVANGFVIELDGRSNFKWAKSLRTKIITFENPRIHLINIKSTGTKFGFNPYFLTTFVAFPTSQYEFFPSQDLYFLRYSHHMKTCLSNLVASSFTLQLSYTLLYSKTLSMKCNQPMNYLDELFLQTLKYQLWEQFDVELLKNASLNPKLLYNEYLNLKNNKDQ